MLRSTPLLVCSLALVPGALLGEESSARLVDVTARTGIEFRHRAGSATKEWIDEVNGSGVALFDADADGRLDVYLLSCGIEPGRGGAEARNRLWRNEGNWRFSDATERSGLGDEGWSSGAIAADVDDDGLVDVYVTNLGPNALYLGRGEGRFERAGRSGAEDPRWSASACFADFDRDGRLDLYVVNYVVPRRDPAKARGRGGCVYKGVEIFCGPGGLEPAEDGLYLNRGGGRFEEVGLAWGLGGVPASYGLGALVIDVRHDGLPDIVVANDTRRNHCLVNRGGRAFDELGVFLGLAYNDYGVEQAGMGLAAADLTGSGREDVFVTNFEDDTNTLYREDEGGLWSEVTFPSGLGTPGYRYLGWGTFFFDLEGDGDLDLFVANGHVAPQVDEVRSSLGYRQRNQVFVNDGAGRFRDALECLPGAESGKRSSRGAACGDLDGDGDDDIVVNDIDSPPTVLENVSPGRRVTVRLEGRVRNRSAVGARVEALIGGRVHRRTLRAGESWSSQCELVARFGLGEAERVESLVVAWPEGDVEAFAGCEAGRHVTLRAGTGRRVGDRR